MKTTVKWIIALSIVLLVVEVGLRLSGKLKTYSEKNFGTYASAYNSNGVDHLFVWRKNDTITSKKQEFTYTYKTNSFGLVDKKNIDTCNYNNTTVFLGDSFVFGVGSPQDSSLPVLLSKKN